MLGNSQAHQCSRRKRARFFSCERALQLRAIPEFSPSPHAILAQIRELARPLYRREGRGGERRRFRQSLPVDRMDDARPLFGLQPRLFDRQPVLCVALADQIGKIRAAGQHTWEILPVFREGSLPENEKHHD
jgi:hypothetical protein